jgi:uncharacterized protein (TIGR00255 family)
MPSKRYGGLFLTSSMTSFARTDFKNVDIRGSWEIKSVNHRFCDRTIRLPEDHRHIEAQVRELITHVVRRGKVDCTLKIDPVQPNITTSYVNEIAVKPLIFNVAKVRSLMSSSQEVSPLDILAWPGVVNKTDTTTKEKESYLLDIFIDTLNEFTNSRTVEGEKLVSIIKTHLGKMEIQLAYLRTRIADIMQSTTKRHEAKLLALGQKLDLGRVEQEIVILISKLDIAEEIDRLSIHIQEVRSVLVREEPVGRRLDFLMQELNREANTVGSKSAHVDTTGASIEFKVLIEQIREQIQNVE